MTDIALPTRKNRPPPQTPSIPVLDLSTLRERLRGPARSRALVSSGYAALDHALGGGFQTAAIHELLAPVDGAAAHTVALSAALQALHSGDSPMTGARGDGCVLYLDSGGDFYPPAAVRVGLPLDRLIVIRPRCAADLLWVCEQALRCALVAALVATPHHMDAYVSRRLQLAAEAGGTLGLLIRTHAAGGSTFAATRVRFDPLAARVSTGVRGTPREDGGTDVRRLLVSVLKVRERKPAEPFVLELSDAAGDVYPHAVSVDRSGLSLRRIAAG
ncbi:MAG: hypothetical protein CHACPFDD_02693 [Phycisphaerae bacterium]|nr:hypothetical protein [Phycisphaerae bacterium]